MLTEICAEIKNYFAYESDRHIGDFAIVNGQITPSLDFPTDYIRIVGSRLNDGVHKISDFAEHPLQDESFHGAVWIMSPPAHFIALAEEIQSWQDAYGKSDSVAMGPYQSESFGGYSYSKSSGGNSNGSGGDSNVPTWQSQYASRLKIYRKIREL